MVQQHYFPHCFGENKSEILDSHHHVDAEYVRERGCARPHEGRDPAAIVWFVKRYSSKVMYDVTFRCSIIYRSETT